MEIKKSFEMDKVSLLKRTDNYVMLGLPYGWKKQCMKRKNSEYWYFYLINSDNKKFRSNAEVAEYLEKNPSVKCDLSVTNTNWQSRLQSILNKLQKPNPDSKEHKTDQIEEFSYEEIEISDEDRANSDDQTAVSHADLAADTENIGIKQTCEMDKVSLLKRRANSVVLALPHGWKKFCLRRQNTDRWDFYLLSSDNKKFRSTVEVKRYLKNNPSVKCDIDVTNTKFPSILKKIQKLNPDSKKRKTDQVLEESEISDEERKTTDEKRKSPGEKREISDEENETLDKESETPDEKRKSLCEKREISDEENETSVEESETLDEEKSKMEQLHSEVTSEPFEFNNSSEAEMC